MNNLILNVREGLKAFDGKSLLIFSWAQEFSTQLRNVVDRQLTSLDFHCFDDEMRICVSR